MAKLLFIWLLFIATACAAPDHFRLWFPQYRGILTSYMKTCMPTYEAYREDRPCQPINYGGCQSGRMVHCLLSQATESLKANMAAAGVILGLLPTTLGLVGSSTVEAGLLALQRPLLSLLLACGAPVTSPIRTFEYRSPIDLVRKRSESIDAPRFTPPSAIVIVALQYIFAFLAIANVAHVSWELCVKTVCSFSSDTGFHPALWAFLAVPLHLIGCLAVVLRFRYQSSESRPGERSWVRRLQAEFQLTARQSPATLHHRKETHWFVVCSWFTSTGTVIHIIYGTLVFSSILFISAQDAVKVVARYLCSALVCRIILMFELMGMRDMMEMET